MPDNDLLLAEYARQPHVRDRHLTALLMQASMWAGATTGMVQTLPLDFGRRRVFAERLPANMNVYLDRATGYFVQSSQVRDNLAALMNPWNDDSVEAVLHYQLFLAAADFFARWPWIEITTEDVRQWFIINELPVPPVLLEPATSLSASAWLVPYEGEIQQISPAQISPATGIPGHAEIKLAHYARQPHVRARQFSALALWAYDIATPEVPAEPSLTWARIRVLAERIPREAERFSDRATGYFMQQQEVREKVPVWLNPFNDEATEQQLSAELRAMIDRFSTAWSQQEVTNRDLLAWYELNNREPPPQLQPLEGLAGRMMPVTMPPVSGPPSYPARMVTTPGPAPIYPQPH